MTQKKIPLRMCVSCREMKPKAELIRIVKNPEGEIFVDDTLKASGRGAYICREKNCFSKCLKSKALNRQFDCAVSDDVLMKIKEKIDEV